MKRWIVCAALGLLVVAGAARSARAEGGPFGIGVIIGSPTGVSMKLYLDRQNAIDAAVGGALLGAGGIHVHADYLWHPLMITRDDAFYLPLYIGLGARVLGHQRSQGREDDVHVGARAVAGILFDLRRVPLDVFLEAALVVDFVFDDGDAEDHSRLGINAGMGIRYYF
jgi:hypothetical protein